jgi:hypothetical protein
MVRRCRQESVRRRTTVRDENNATIKTCGFVFTTTGRPCANHVADKELYCRAGHPCANFPARRDVPPKAAAPRRHVFPLSRTPSAALVPDRRRRAAVLLARALSHEDAEADGVWADKVLADHAVALALLGAPEADPAARDAVVQHFGLVGALLVVAHEDRWRRHLAVLSGDAGSLSAADAVSGHLERLVKSFPHLDVGKLEALMSDIDRSESGCRADRATAVRRRLHAAYAVAARDGSDVSHHVYMDALNEVLKMTRPALAA